MSRYKLNVIIWKQFPGGKRSASAAKRYEDALKRDRMEYERKYNRPVDDAEANAAAFMNQSGGGYDPIKNGNLVVLF